MNGNRGESFRSLLKTIKHISPSVHQGRAGWVSLRVSKFGCASLARQIRGRLHLLYFPLLTPVASRHGWLYEGFPLASHIGIPIRGGDKGPPAQAQRQDAGFDGVVSPNGFGHRVEHPLGFQTVMTGASDLYPKSVHSASS